MHSVLLFGLVLKGLCSSDVGMRVESGMWAHERISGEAV